MILMALTEFIGICRWRASPFPEPQGIIPSADGVPTMERATSLIVPSPPTATIASMPISAAAFAISAA